MSFSFFSASFLLRPAMMPALVDSDCGKFLSDAEASATFAGNWAWGSSSSAPFLKNSFVAHFCDLAKSQTSTVALTQLQKVHWQLPQFIGMYVGGLKTRDWKMQDSQKCMVRQCGTGKRSTKMQDWKTWD